MPVPGSVDFSRLDGFALLGNRSDQTFSTASNLLHGSTDHGVEFEGKFQAGVPAGDASTTRSRSAGQESIFDLSTGRATNTRNEELLKQNHEQSRGRGVDSWSREEGRDHKTPVLSSAGVPVMPAYPVKPTTSPVPPPTPPASEPIPGPGAPGSRVQFAPVFTSPTMQWAVPSTGTSGGGGFAYPVPPASLPAPSAGKNGAGQEVLPPDYKSGDKGAKRDYYNSSAGEGGEGRGNAKLGYFQDRLSEDEGDKRARETLRDSNPARNGGEGKVMTIEEVKAKSEETAQNQPPKTEPAPAEQKQPDTQRKIIRSGEIEFEVKSFDDAVAAVSTLVRGTKGGFIATINSDKLPNGKVYGSVVVRVPPEELDDLVLNLRKKLTEAGELKGQRIGSQDITKQYTDLESRLRAARTMEERLLKIIKEGKGEIKDLLQAEKELGVWRTKIEEQEGELRYYANQVSLSTLVITMAEKEIRAAAQVTEVERIQAGIEVEDVEKAREDALEAILKAGGRVSRSELKQHAAGQYTVVLNFEVAPEKTGEVRDRLRQIGNMVRLEIDRVQQTDDGQSVPRDVKVKRGDSQFFVNIYNLANFTPREIVVVRVAAADVPEAYQKLREVVGTVKTQARNVALNVQNVQNVTAQVDFDVRRTDEGMVQAAIKNAGEVLSRSVSRSPEGENVTDSKIGYRIELINIVNVPPREIITLRLAASNVNDAYDRLREVVSKAAGRVLNLQLNVQDQRNVTAQLDFDVRRSEDGTVHTAIVTAGDVITRHVSRQPEGEHVTDTRVGYRIQFISMNSIPARETRVLRLAATKIADAHAELLRVIEKVKGHVVNDQLNVNDPQNMSAQLDVVIRAGDELALETAIKSTGETISRQVARQPDGDSVTNSRIAYRIELVNVVSIPARETVVLKIAAPSVADAYERLRDAVAGKGRIDSAELNAQDQQNVTARLHFEVARGEDNDAIKKELKDSGEAMTRQVNRKAEGQNVTDMRVRYEVELVNAGTIPPRETLTLGVEVADVEEAQAVVIARVKEAGGRVVSSQVGQPRSGQSYAKMTFTVPLAARTEIVEMLKKVGQVRGQDVVRDPQATEGAFALAQFQLTLATLDPLVPRDQSFWAQLRHGLSISFLGLFASLSWLIAGVLFVLPWLLLVLAVMWVVRRFWRNTAVETPPTASSATSAM